MVIYSVCESHTECPIPLAAAQQRTFHSPPERPVRSVIQEQTGGSRLRDGHTLTQIAFRIADMSSPISRGQVEPDAESPVRSNGSTNRTLW